MIKYNVKFDMDWCSKTFAMENKILKKKLLFHHHLLYLYQYSLAWQLGKVQTKLSIPRLPF